MYLILNTLLYGFHIKRGSNVSLATLKDCLVNSVTVQWKQHIYKFGDFSDKLIKWSFLDSYLLCYIKINWPMVSSGSRHYLDLQYLNVQGLRPYLWNLDAACWFVLDWEPSSSSPSVSLSSESSCFHHNKQTSEPSYLKYTQITETVWSYTYIIFCREMIIFFFS